MLEIARENNCYNGRLLTRRHYSSSGSIRCRVGENESRHIGIKHSSRTEPSLQTLQTPVGLTPLSVPHFLAPEDEQLGRNECRIKREWGPKEGKHESFRDSR